MDRTAIFVFKTAQWSIENIKDRIWPTMRQAQLRVGIQPSIRQQLIRIDKLDISLL